MKKCMIFPMLLLLLLTACQTAPVDDDKTLSGTPSSSGTVTLPSYSTRPSTSTPATSIPATNPLEPDETGYSFVYDGTAPFIGIDADCSGCTVGHLYWVDKTSGDVTPILEEPALESIEEGAYVYYVKSDEPTKIYRTPIEEFSQHEIIYESTYGKVSKILIDTFVVRKELVLQFVADNKKFVVLDLTTGEDHVLLEQYYIKSAYFSDSCSDTWIEQNIIVFRGRVNENDTTKVYRYFRNTGTLREIQEQCED